MDALLPWLPDMGANCAPQRFSALRRQNHRPLVKVLLEIWMGTSMISVRRRISGTSHWNVAETT